MLLRTILPHLESKSKFDLADSFLTMGSCFSGSIGSLLQAYKFRTLVNPFGTMYDPLSIARILNYAIDGTLPAENSYVETNGIWANLNTHSSFSALSSEEVKLKIQGTLATVAKFLSQTDWLLITFGTSWIYQYKQTGEWVANCHKIPSSQFAKSLCDLTTLKNTYKELIKKLVNLNPNIKILITVSPVRHIKDTFPKNNLSKSVLRLFTEELESSYDNIFYYPAFEILMDDLRDYRFYQADMIHPTDQAVTYIWDHFIQSFANTATQEFIIEWQKIKMALEHRPFHPQSEQHQQFLRQLLIRLEKFADQVDIKQEKRMIEAQMSNN